MAGSPSQDIALAVRETKEWIEEVTGRRFPADCSYRAGLEDGILLCELMEKLSPGSIRKINRSPSPIAYLDNIQQFLLSCKDLGLRDEQLFDMMDLQDPQSVTHDTGVDMKTEVDRRLKSVCVTVFWLGKVVSEMRDYSGPQLNLNAFRTVITHEQVSEGSSSSSVLASQSSRPQEGENEASLTFEEEQTADQLLADIQSAVDEMLQDFQTNTLSPESPPIPPPSQPPLPPSTVDKWPHPHNSMRVEVHVQMSSGGRGFGFQVSGGADTAMPARVDIVLPGSAAEEGGLRSGDEITSINGQNVTSLGHTHLVSIIRKAGAEGHISMGLMRALKGKEGDTAPQPSHEDTHLQEQHRQASILKHMYPKSHHLLDAQLGPSLTPVLEEEVDMSNPLPPLPGESCLPPITENSPLPPLPGEFPSPPVPSVSPLPPLPGEISPLPVLPEVAALASVRDSVRELKDLEEQMGGDAPTPPQTHSSPSPRLLSTPSQETEEAESHGLEEESEEQQLTSEDMEIIMQELEHETDREGGGEGVGGREGEEGGVGMSGWRGNDQPWEPKTQWEDNIHQGEKEWDVGREGRKGKIWSFLEEKTRVSKQERELAVSSKAVAHQEPAPNRKTPPPVLPKPLRKKDASGQQPLTHTPPVNHRQQKGEEGEEVPHVNGPIPSPDPNIITIQSTSSTEPLNIRPVTHDEVELHGDIKIQKVAHTRWTPQKKSPDQLHRTMSTPPYLRHSPAEGPPHPQPYLEARQLQPPAGASKQPRQYEESRPTRRYTGAPPIHQVGLPGAPPTYRGPIRQQSLPQHLTRFHQQAPQNTVRLPQQNAAHSLQQNMQPPQHGVAHPHLPLQQQQASRTQPRQPMPLAEQTRVGGTGGVPGLMRGRVQSTSVPSQVNGGPKYDSLLNAFRQARQHGSQQQPQVVDGKARSHTWGARERHQYLGQPSRGGRPALALPEQKQDGLQQAFLVRPADPHLPCSLCRRPMGPQPLIAIPGLHLHFHPHCFVCPVCHTPLAPPDGHTSTTTVMVRSMRPHCHYCTSNTQGVQATEC